MEHRTGAPAGQLPAREIRYTFGNGAAPAEPRPAPAVLGVWPPIPQGSRACPDCVCCQARLCAQAYADGITCSQASTAPEAGRDPRMVSCPCTLPKPGLSADTVAS